MGAVAVLATLAGQQIVRRATGTGRAVGYTVTFLVAFAVYEAALYAISATLLGGTEIYTVAIQGRIFLIDAGAFAALLVLHRLAISVGLTVNAPIGLSMTESRV